jgi:outer membrane protein assembly factor BamD
MTAPMRRPTPALRVFAFALIGACATVACDPPPAKTATNYTDDAKKAYDEGVEKLDSHDYLEAQLLLREVARKFPYTKWGRLAELRSADADFAQEKYTEATRGYRKFIHDHRSDDEEIAYARAKIAEAQYREIGDSFLAPSTDERDQSAIQDAYKELRSYLADYPAAKESKHVQELLADVLNRLVRHELSVARFYFSRGNYEAAVGRIQYALRNFSRTRVETKKGTKGEGIEVDSGREPEALFLLAETYMKMQRWEDASGALEILVAQYPLSELRTQAKSYLVFLATKTPAKAANSPSVTVAKGE